MTCSNHLLIIYTLYIYFFAICQSFLFVSEKIFTVCAISICFADRLSRQIFALHFCQNTLCILFTKKKGDQFALTASTGFYLSKSLKALPALNAGTFEAAIVIFSPVLGFLLSRAALSRDSNVPNPTS